MFYGCILLSVGGIFLIDLLLVSRLVFFLVLRLVLRFAILLIFLVSILLGLILHWTVEFPRPLEKMMHKRRLIVWLAGV